MSKRVSIVGAGVAGLSAGCYLRMNGYRVSVYEKAPHPGGLCASWKRKGYTFDISTHWLVGSRPSSFLYKIWDELHILRGVTVQDHKYFKKIHGKNGTVLTVYSDVDRLYKEMLEIAPGDKKAIKEFISGIRLAKKVKLPVEKPRELYNFIDYLTFPFKYYHLIRFVLKWRPLRIKAFAKRFADPVLRDLFLNIFTDHDDFSMVSQLLTLGWYSNHEAGRPLGGSLTVVRNLERRFKELGGEVFYNSEVIKIKQKGSAVCGLRVQKGTGASCVYEDVESAYVISAADMVHTLKNLLTGVRTKKFDNYIGKLVPYPSFFDVNIGVNADFNMESLESVNYYLDEPFELEAGHAVERLTSHFFNFDKNCIPPGKTAIMTHVRSHRFEFWKELRENDPEGYKNLKQKLAEKIIDVVDKTFSTDEVRIKENIEVIDVCTPYTYYRWTYNYRGSYEGWIPDPYSTGRNLSKTVTGLEGFYFCGQWVEPGGGLPSAAMSGRNVAQLICARDKKKFKTFC